MGDDHIIVPKTYFPQKGDYKYLVSREKMNDQVHEIVLMPIQFITSKCKQAINISINAKTDENDKNQMCGQKDKVSIIPSIESKYILDLLLLHFCI